ncbi:hypothetical protein [Luteibaculum oceani]|uniref:Uncharacterized protein n=1 Tax=Luteibaculum oceani TaxID=1294296 RepID=A0A5C6VPN7_9FLAO|nr:hypothetical protein [Luteibaculum oceani]TXC85248.1 hypothetical protein FRX97_01090 [Luteibaculum oceani]
MKITTNESKPTPQNQVFIGNDTVNLTRAVVSYYGYDSTDENYFTVILLYNGEDFFPNGEYNDSVSNIADLLWIAISLYDPGLPKPGKYSLMYSTGQGEEYLEFEMARNQDLGVDTTESYYFSDDMVHLEILNLDEQRVDLKVSGTALNTATEETIFLSAAYSGNHHYEDSVASNSWAIRYLDPKLERLRK